MGQRDREPGAGDGTADEVKDERVRGADVGRSAAQDRDEGDEGTADVLRDATPRKPEAQPQGDGDPRGANRRDIDQADAPRPPTPGA